MGWETALILGLGSLLGGLFGGGKTTQTSTTPSRMDPLYAILSPMMMGNAVGAMDWLGKDGGFGGSGLFNFNPLVGKTGQNMNDYILAQLTKQLPYLINNGKLPSGGSTTPKDPADRRDKSRFGREYNG